MKSLPLIHLTVQRLGLAFAVLAFITTQPAFAQIAPTNEPSNIQKRFEEPAEPRVSTQPAIVAPAQPGKTYKYKGSFTLNDVTFRGNTAYSDAELKALFADYIGQKTTLAELDSAVQAINAKYRVAGYLLTLAAIQDKRPENGVVVVAVVEGYVENVVVEGKMYANDYGKKLVESYAQKITEERPLKAATIERYILLIDDLPGVTAKGVVRKGSRPGATDLVIIMDQKRIEGSAELNNRGTKFVGRNQLQATLVGNSVLGIFDRTLLRFVGAPREDLRFFDVQHEEQIGTEGTKLRLIASHADVEPGDSLKTLNIEGKSTEFAVQLQSPIIRSRKENLVPRAELSWRDSDVKTLGVETSEDKLRVVRVGGAYDIADDWEGINLFDAEISQGLDIFGAKDGVGSSRADGEADFTKVNLDISRLQNLPNNFSILAQLTGQYAFDPLQAPEEFTLGGIGFGQAYDPAELAGDHGAALRLELRWANLVNEPYFNSYQLYGYFDRGSIWQKDPLPGVTPRQSLASAGAGVRANFNENFSGNLELARPLTRNVSAEGDDDTRLFFSVIGRF